jgi:hypothetical protein
VLHRGLRQRVTPLLHRLPSQLHPIQARAHLSMSNAERACTQLACQMAGCATLRTFLFAYLHREHAIRETTQNQHRDSISQIGTKYPILHAKYNFVYPNRNSRGQIANIVVGRLDDPRMEAKPWQNTVDFGKIWLDHGVDSPCLSAALISPDLSLMRYLPIVTKHNVDPHNKLQI